MFNIQIETSQAKVTTENVLEMVIQSCIIEILILTKTVTNL